VETVWPFCAETRQTYHVEGGINDLHSVYLLQSNSALNVG